MSIGSYDAYPQYGDAPHLLPEYVRANPYEAAELTLVSTGRPNALSEALGVDVNGRCSTISAERMYRLGEADEWLELSFGQRWQALREDMAAIVDVASTEAQRPALLARRRSTVQDVRLSAQWVLDAMTWYQERQQAIDRIPDADPQRRMAQDRLRADAGRNLAAQFAHDAYLSAAAGYTNGAWANLAFAFGELPAVLDAVTAQRELEEASVQW